MANNYIIYKIVGPETNVQKQSYNDNLIIIKSVYGNFIIMHIMFVL